MRFMLLFSFCSGFCLGFAHRGAGRRVMPYMSQSRMYRQADSIRAKPLHSQRIFMSYKRRPHALNTSAYCVRSRRDTPLRFESGYGVLLRSDTEIYGQEPKCRRFGLIGDRNCHVPSLKTTQLPSHTDSYLCPTYGEKHDIRFRLSTPRGAHSSRELCSQVFGREELIHLHERRKCSDMKHCAFLRFLATVH